MSSVAGVKIIINTDRGETHVFELDSLEAAIEFMENFDKERYLDTSQSLSLPELAVQSSQSDREEVEFLEGERG